MSKASEKKAYPSAIAVERSVEILFLLAENGAAALTEIVAALEMSPSGVHRILTALKRKGLVDQDPLTERYQLSWSVLDLARSVSGRNELRTFALPFMTELRDLTGETIALYARHGMERVCIEQVESRQEVRYCAEVGRVLPLYAGASGLALLAFLPNAELEEFLGSVQLRPLTARTVTDRRALEQELARIRDRGFVVADQDRVVGLAGISAPVLDATSSARAVMTISGPSARMGGEPPAEWVRALLDATRRLSEQLGGPSGARAA